ncbi:MAG: hypothetical protein K6E75_03690 [Lachnospiraceae bacterium]|nr:hypothetical protein [Lachnospiraceae bacterium]
MKKIIKYEAKIILCKPYVAILLVINLLYSYYLLSADIILGVSDTAPFSGWSFGKYMGSGALWTLLISLFILAYSRAGKKNVSVLTDVTAISPKKLNLIRSLIVTGFFLVGCLVIFILGCVFLWVMFQSVFIGYYVVSFLLITLPCMGLIIGIGTLVGDARPAVIYACIVLILCVSCLASVRIGTGSGLWHLFDAAGASYYETVSAQLETLEASETPFVINVGYLASRVLYMVLGIAAFAIGFAGAGKKQKDPEIA